MTGTFRKHVLVYIAMALVLALTVTAVAVFRGTGAASAETVVLTSPFTEAVAKVRDSVVGVNNYQLVSSYSNGGNDYYSPWDYFFYGYGYPNSRGNGRGNGSQDSSREVQSGSGSGVVVAKEYVLTNYHVVDHASSLKVSVLKDGDTEATLYDATVAAADENKDVAVLYVPGLPLNPVELGDSDQLVVGDWAICIGNPGNGAGSIMTGTVTAGIISALDREVDSGSTSTDPYGRKVKTKNKMIQTDAAINNGNSGGGMFNTAGQLVGIPNMKYSGTRSSMSALGIENIGLCIPINEAKDVIEQALNAEAAQPETQNTENTENEGDASSSAMFGKPRLGVSVTTFNGAEMTNGVLPNGVYILSVEQGGPAEAAGLLPGDIILEANGTVTPTFEDMSAVLLTLKEGDTVSLKIWRPDLVEDASQGQISTTGKDLDIQVVLKVLDAVAQ
ncbi:MAG: trypsin-like peptidase domain-containing protein [Clostridia bacterium]|nr:trypsin-like peptidase domain-containing protein [Clostridia bacterium]